MFGGMTLTKRFLSLSIAFLFALVLMLHPVKAEAAPSYSDISISVRGGAPEITGSTSSFGDTDTTRPSVSYKVIFPVTVTLSNATVGKYLSGYFSINVNTTFHLRGIGTYNVQITGLSCNVEEIDFEYFNESKSYSGELSAEKLVCSDDLSIKFANSVYNFRSTLKLVCYVEYTITMLTNRGVNDMPYIYGSPVCVSSYTGYGTYLNESDLPPEKGWIAGKFDSIVNSISLWGQNIVNAITGQGGGANIDSAQEGLDNQLSVLDQAESQLSDSVKNKIDVPSLSLTSDESSGLTWVISTINSLYLTFDQLHVLFACVVFFGIFAVILFGRRNL